MTHGASHTLEFLMPSCSERSDISNSRRSERPISWLCDRRTASPECDSHFRIRERPRLGFCWFFDCHPCSRFA